MFTYEIYILKQIFLFTHMKFAGFQDNESSYACGSLRSHKYVYATDQQRSKR